MDTVTTTGLDALKTTSKKAVYKTGETTGEVMGNKIAENCETKICNWWEFKERNYPTWKREEILKELREVL